MELLNTVITKGNKYSAYKKQRGYEKSLDNTTRNLTFTVVKSPSLK